MNTCCSPVQVQGQRASASTPLAFNGKNSAIVLYFLLILLGAGCAHHPSTPSFSSSSSSGAPQYQQVDMTAATDASHNSVPADSTVVEGVSPTTSPSSGPTSLSSTNEAVPGSETEDDYEDYVEEKGQDEKPGIADPLEPFNRAMYHFNDKLYFWVLKPVGQGYRKVVPEKARISVSNFFSNISTPIRFVNCLLQANIGGAATELGRFVVNTTWGVVGLFDPASNDTFNLQEQDEDFGQTLGVYGLGQGFFITWPIFGPSSPRDTIGMLGDSFLQPVNYLEPWEASAGVKAYDMVNGVSLRIGDYEALKEAAIDPYVAIRNAYVQHRLHKVKERGVTKKVSSDSSKQDSAGEGTLP